MGLRIDIVGLLSLGHLFCGAGEAAELGWYSGEEKGEVSDRMVWRRWWSRCITDHVNSLRI